MASVQNTSAEGERPRRARLHKVILLSASLLFALAVAEIGLRIIEKMQLGDRAIEQTVVDDPELGHRLPPFASGHDANGFRNDTVPEHADIVVLGDSQTWGVNATRPEAWPQQLGQLSKRSVYTMALGGYGAVQYWVLAGRALKFSPKILVVGLYLGNDIYDAYQIVYSNERYAALRRDEATSRELSQDTVAPRAKGFWDEEKNFHYSFGRSTFSGWSLWLRQHTAIGRLLNSRGLWPGASDVEYEIDKAWAQTHPENGAVYEDRDVGTVLTPAYRLTALDLGEPRIAEGLRLTRDLISRIKERASTANAQVLILLIPTKEMVYADALKSRGELSGAYGKLVEMETRVRTELLESCQNGDVKCVDALPALSASIKRRERAYPSSTESHPNAQGYRILATTVNDAIRELGW